MREERPRRLPARRNPAGCERRYPSSASGYPIRRMGVPVSDPYLAAVLMTATWRETCILTGAEGLAVTSLMIEAAIDVLLNSQNPDGGWGVTEGRRSTTETTSLALLGLGTLGDRSLAKRTSRGLSWLSERQNPDGGWPLDSELRESSWPTSLAVLCLALFEDHRQRALRGARWLIRQQGRGLGWLSSLLYRLAPSKLAAQLNPDLKGWSWTPGAFSWVEPTAYALIALKKLRPSLRGTQAEERIRQGELMLYDRMCEGGGWNYGNSKVLGENLPPYPDTTALALIALQDRHEEANRLSLQALRRMLTGIESGLALSWSILCLSLYNQQVSQWRERLASRYAKAGFLGEIKPIALALLASGDSHEAFRVSTLQ